MNAFFGTLTASIGKTDGLISKHKVERFAPIDYPNMFGIKLISTIENFPRKCKSRKVEVMDITRET